MAFNGAAASSDQARLVAEITGFGDHAVIIKALQGNHGDVDKVVNEFYEGGADKFRRMYGLWDESAFSSGREGEDTSGTNPNLRSFAIEPPVIYGTEPGNFYGAPSRPPSRANNRSPISRLIDAATAQYTTDTPSNRQEEEDQLQRAINESLSASGVQSPDTFPPPPPPLPQQSGVTTNNWESSAQFGPANRPDYDPDEWAMVRLGNQDADPDPTLRARKEGAPVFLRCRKKKDEWGKHRLGPVLTIFQQIPAVRNALLQTGEAPGYGYGNKSDWWRGEAIALPGQSDPDGWANDPTVSWSDEVHRLMAFLELTERAYGTADVLAKARHPETHDTDDPEKDFFQSFSESRPNEDTLGIRETLISSVEVVYLDNFSPQGGDRFGLLDLQIGKDNDPLPETLYNVLDWLFFVDLRLAREDPSATRMAWISQASEVLTCRFQGDGLPAPVQIPETFYIDRYLKSNGQKLQELQMEMITLLEAYDASMRKEADLIRWVNPQTNKAYDRRVLIKASVRRCQEKMARIRHRAFWRKHVQAPAEGEGEYYLADHRGEPSLLPEEASLIAHYESKIQQLEAQVAEMERVMNELIIPERRAINEVNRKMSSLLTVPSTDEKWNPTHKYTLRGVVNDMNTVYQRMRGPVSESGATPTEDVPASGEERWWKTSFKTEDNTVEHTPVSYETVMREACATGCLPILVYATDKAMQQDNLPLPDALRTFVRLDNRHFKQELSQSDRLGHKRSAGGAGGGSQSKRLQRSSSMDSMDTNHASAGDFDDDMRDAPFDNDSMFGVAGGGGGGRTTTPNRAATGQDESIPDLVDIAPTSGTMTAPPSYENYIEMEAGVSPALALAQVSLQDLKSRSGGSSPPKAQEMLERPNTPFLARLNSNTNNNNSGGGGGGGATANGAVQNAAAAVATTVDEEEPLIDLSDPHDAGPQTRVVNGV